MSIYKKLREVKTMPELDALRPEVLSVMNGGDFNKAQKAFIKAKNRLKRIPLKYRNW
jgi:hypothetical protein